MSAEDGIPAGRRLGALLFDRVPRAVLATLLLIAVAINFANVVGRYLFGAAIFWAEEILVYCVIWSVFLGMAAVTYNGAHLAMDLVSSRLPGAARLAVNAALAAVLFAGAIIVDIQSLKVLALFARTGQVSVTAGVPLIIPHAAIPVGFALVALAVAVRIRSYLTGRFD